MNDSNHDPKDDPKTKKDQLQTLTLRELNVTELERRLELAAGAAQQICTTHSNKDD